MLADTFMSHGYFLVFGCSYREDSELHSCVAYIDPMFAELALETSAIFYYGLHYHP